MLDELRPVHVVGLTATNPAELTEAEAALYRELLGEVDFFIPTPAVVREGHLAPYQELVQLCEPLASERDWLAERHARLERLLVELDTPDELGLSAWLLARLRERRSASGGAAVVDRARAPPAARWPSPGCAGCTRAASRRPPARRAASASARRSAIDDWVVLLDDYALRCLRAGADASGDAARRLDALQVALGDLGFTLTRAGIRRTGGDVDRVLLHSAAKPIAMCDALATASTRRAATRCARRSCATPSARRASRRARRWR